MKSSAAHLGKRGMVGEADLAQVAALPTVQLCAQIDSPDASRRSAAVRILAERGLFRDEEWIFLLLGRLCREDCLYTRLEICNALERGGETAARQMVRYLGRIGNNQHRYLPERISRKVSYPLPRDIIARSLGRMGSGALPVLLAVLDGDEEEKISEALDGLGYLLFYRPELGGPHVYARVLGLLEEYKDRELLLWKTVQCLSAFPPAEEALREVANNGRQPVIRAEAQRSLRLIAARES